MLLVTLSSIERFSCCCDWWVNEAVHKERWTRGTGLVFAMSFIKRGQRNWAEVGWGMVGQGTLSLKSIIKLYADSAKTEILKIHAGRGWGTVVCKVPVVNFSGETLLWSEIHMVPVASELL